MTHIASQAGSRMRYGERCRERQNSARGWIKNQKQGMVE
jgi:hypothetical protein